MAVQGTIKKAAPSLRLLVGTLFVVLLCREGCSARLHGAALGSTANWMDSGSNGWISGGIFSLQINNPLENSEFISAFLQAAAMGSGQKLPAGRQLVGCH